RAHLSVLHKHRWLAVTCFAVTVVSTAVLTLLTPRLYTASTRLEVARQSPIQLRLEGNVLRLGESDRDANGAATFVGMQVAALRRCGSRPRTPPCRPFSRRHTPRRTWRPTKRRAAPTTSRPRSSSGASSTSRGSRWSAARRP